jgi:hypothetical protein
MELQKIIELSVTALLGGGLWHIINFQLRRRSESAKVNVEEYNTLEKIIGGTSKQTLDLLGELQKLASTQAEMMETMNRVKENYHKLKMLVTQMLNEYEGTETPTITALRNEVK